MRRTFLLLAVSALAAFAQEPKPSFEVASVRPGSGKPMVINGMSIVGAMQGGPGTDDPEHLRMSNVPLRQVVLAAYDVKPFRLFGPDWIADTRYDIEAKIAPGATREQFRLMLQDLLEQRFGIRARHENRNYKAYSLVVSKGGLKLKDKVPTDACAAGAMPASGTCPPRSAMIYGIARSDEGVEGRVSIGAREGYIIASGRSATMRLIAMVLAASLQGEEVFDKTGVDGNYDFRLEYTSINVGVQGDPGIEDLFTALEHETGLKLEPGIVPQDTLVIDKISRPTEN